MLYDLSMFGTGMDDNSGMALAEGLKHPNNHVECLNLHEYLKENVEQAIVKAMKSKNSKVKDLAISLSSNGAKALAATLMDENCKVEYLVLRRDLSVNTLTSVCNSIKHPQSKIRGLDLSIFRA